MSVPRPHFLLYSKTDHQSAGRWSFLLKSHDGSAVMKARDCEPATQGERLELLAVVRGLEALDQPSQVTLVTSSSYVHRGITDGLEEWRRNGWMWESFGEMVPVKNQDLWRRLDRALGFHRLDVRMRRVAPTPTNSVPASVMTAAPLGRDPTFDVVRRARLQSRRRSNLVGRWWQGLRNLAAQPALRAG